MAFRDDGLMLAAGTSNGRVAFYDVRGKPQPFVVLHAYGSSEVILFASLAMLSQSAWFNAYKPTAGYCLIFVSCDNRLDLWTRKYLGTA